MHCSQEFESLAESFGYILTSCPLQKGLSIIAAKWGKFPLLSLKSKEIAGNGGLLLH